MHRRSFYNCYLAPNPSFHKEGLRKTRLLENTSKPSNFKLKIDCCVKSKDDKKNN